MELERSRNGFYTLTFRNKLNKDTKEILEEFNTVGKVAGIVNNFQRIFVRFNEKEEVERALAKFGSVYELRMAKNKFGDNHHSEEGISHNRNHSHRHSQNHVPLETADIPGVTENMEEMNISNNIFHLILGNLPKNYTVKDVSGLVAEAKPVSISQLDETRVFHIKFCHIALDSAENLSYLIDKLNGFVICGEKLIAAEAKHLLEWKEKSV